MYKDEALDLLKGGEQGISEWNRKVASGKAILDLDGVKRHAAKLRGTRLRGKRLRRSGPPGAPRGVLIGELRPPVELRRRAGPAGAAAASRSAWLSMALIRVGVPRARRRSAWACVAAQTASSREFSSWMSRWRACISRVTSVWPASNRRSITATCSASASVNLDASLTRSAAPFHRDTAARTWATARRRACSAATAARSCSAWRWRTSGLPVFQIGTWVI